jgi:hypothetical protein
MWCAKCKSDTSLGGLFYSPRTGGSLICWACFTAVEGHPPRLRAVIRDGDRARRSQAAKRGWQTRRQRQRGDL